MDNVSKVLFKEIMVFVKEFESLGNRWCEENDLASVAQARSYGKKIMSAMKPFIEASIKETDAAIAAEAAKLSSPVVEEVKVPEEVVEAPIVEVAVEAPPVIAETISADIAVETLTVAQESKVSPEKKEAEIKNRGFNFNKRK